jgi:hypothetical protein
MATETKAEIIAAERLRISAIMESDAGKRNPKAALKLALFSDMSAAMIGDMLAGLPVESPFVAAMDREGVIGIHGPIGAAPSGDAKSTRLQELKRAAASHSIAHGYTTPERQKAKGVDLGKITGRF